MFRDPRWPERCTGASLALPVMVSAVESALADLLERAVASPVVVLAAWPILTDDLVGRSLGACHWAKELLRDALLTSQFTLALDRRRPRPLASWFLVLHVNYEALLALRAWVLAMHGRPWVTVRQEQVSFTIFHHVRHAYFCSLYHSALDVSPACLAWLWVTTLEPSRHELALDRVILRLNGLFVPFTLFADPCWRHFIIFLSANLLNTFATFHISVVLFSLILRLEFRASHSIDTLGIQWVLDPKIGLCKLLALAVRLDGRIKTAKFLLLFTHAKMCHYLDRDEVVQLVIQALYFLTRCIWLLNTFVLNLVTELVTA